MLTSLTIETIATREMLRTRVANVILPNRVITIENEVDRPRVSSLKMVGLNTAMLPWETLYLLEDGVTTKLKAWELFTLQVMSEQCINIKQLHLQLNEAVE